MPTKDLQHFHITTWTIIRFFVVAVALLGIYLIADILAALFFAVIVASAMEPAIGWFKERKVSRIPAVIIIYLVLVAIFFFVIYLIFPLLIEELRDLSFSYPDLQQKVVAEVERAVKIPLLSFFNENLEGLVRIPSSYMDKIGGGIFNLASLFFGGILSFVLIVIFSFYLAAQERGIENFLRLLTPATQELYVIDLWERSQRKLGRWLRAQILLGALVGVLIFLGLTIMDVDNALLFAMLAAVFEIIPVVGPIMAAIPPTIVAFFSAPLAGVWVVLLFIAVQQIESHVIIPVVMRKTVGLSPLIVVLALLVGAKIGGVFGILLAVPIAAILAELVNDWDKKKRALIPE